MGNTHNSNKHYLVPEDNRKSQKRSSGNSISNTFQHRLSSKSNHSNNGYEQQIDTNSITTDHPNSEILIGLPILNSSSVKDSTVSSILSSNEQFKILLCGSGSSGKTTFLKSIELHKKGSFMETSHMKGMIYFNIIKDLGLLCREYLSVATEFLNFQSNLSSFQDKLLSEMFPKDIPHEITNAMERMIKIATSKSFLQSAASRSSPKQYNPTFDTFFNEQTFEDIETLWKYRPFNLFAHFHLTHANIPEYLTSVLIKMDNSAVGSISSSVNGENELNGYCKFMLTLRNNDYDDLIYFLDTKLYELYPPYQYDPNWIDLLHKRQKTVGFYHLNYVQDVISEEGMRETRNYIFVDTGGQRSERKKWSVCYPHTFSLFYFVSLADINLTLYESNVENRLMDSLHLFEQVCKEPDLIQVPIILFFTKTDILRRKIKNGLKPIELFEKMERLLQDTTLENDGKSREREENDGKSCEREDELLPSLNVSSRSNNQVETELNQFIEFISGKFKEKQLPTQTLTIYSIDNTDANQFKTIFNNIIVTLNKIVKD